MLIIVFFHHYHIGHLSKITTFSHLFLFLGSFINYTVWSSHIMSQGYYKVILLEEEQIGGFRTFIIIAWGNNIFVRLSVLLRKTMRSCRTDFIHCYALHIGLIFLYLIQCQNANTHKQAHTTSHNINIYLHKYKYNEWTLTFRLEIRWDHYSLFMPKVKTNRHRKGSFLSLFSQCVFIWCVGKTKILRTIRCHNLLHTYHFVG